MPQPAAEPAAELCNASVQAGYNYDGPDISTFGPSAGPRDWPTQTAACWKRCCATSSCTLFSVASDTWTCSLAANASGTTFSRPCAVANLGRVQPSPLPPPPAPAQHHLIFPYIGFYAPQAWYAAQMRCHKFADACYDKYAREPCENATAYPVGHCRCLDGISDCIHGIQALEIPTNRDPRC